MKVDRREIGAVFVGGALGTLARAEIAVWIPPRPGHWPWATLVANLAGAFILGAFVARHARVDSASDVLHLRFVRTGLCGGLTTFSTLQVELLWMLDHDRPAVALSYAAVSTAGGWLAVALAANHAPSARPVR